MSPEEQEGEEPRPFPPATQRDSGSIPVSQVGPPYAANAQFYAGPLPPPDILQGYNEVIPNGAERIFAVFEKQAAHRMEMEREERISAFQLANLGLNRATVVCSLGFVVAAILALAGPGLAAGGVTVIDIGAIAGTFILGTARGPRQRQPPGQEMSESEHKG